MRFGATAAVIAAFGFASTLCHAQEPTPLPTEPPPIPSAPAPIAPVSCVPACRSGFVCVQNACVSACNPACGANETCDDAGQCIANAPPSQPRRTRADEADDTPPEPKRSPHARNHDGFYFRIAIGAGGFVANGDVRDNNVNAYEGKITSAAAMTEIAMGGTIAPGLVLGGGAWTSAPVSPTFTYRTLASGETPASPEREVKEPTVLPFGLIGPFLDWYVNPHQGFHIQAAGGFANAAYEEPSDNEDLIFLIGAGGMFGLGWEWWIGNQWSMGLLARVTAASVSGTDPTDKNEDHSVFLVAPGGLLTFTYH